MPNRLTILKIEYHHSRGLLHLMKTEKLNNE